MPTPSLKEVFFPDGEIIVSKTDLKGRITYANRTFTDVCGYKARELLGQPHSIVRHPDMPRAVFKLLWDTISAKQEIFAYVKNMTKHGDFYWVFAHVTPSFDANGALVSYHSSRRVPKRAAIQAVAPLYAAALAAEARHKNGKEALAAGLDCLVQALSSAGVPYDKFVLGL